MNRPRAPGVHSIVSMGLLKSVSTGQRCLLESEHLVGRSPLAGLQLPNSYVSGQHAVIRWTADGWELRDLGSRNGTSVDGTQVETGQVVPLRRGSVIVFGQAEQSWELADDEPPLPMVVAMDGAGDPIVAEQGVLALPSQDEPLVTLLRQADGLWALEAEDNTTPLVSGQVFEVAGMRWRFSSPGVVGGTSSVEGASRSDHAQSQRLEFGVSADEEHVELTLSSGGSSISLGSRAHNYVLLLLARQRLADREAGIPDPACGWVYRDDLLNALKVDRERLNIDIFRIRRQFAAAGQPDAAAVIERRPSSQQLRIGFSELHISVL